jgi:carnitine 3-dehydrogenase
MTAIGIDRVAVVGTGLIGSAWAALFLGRGLEVVAIDPRPEAPAELARLVGGMAEAMRDAGILPADAAVDPGKVRFVQEPGPALEGVGLVQENAPERLALKQALFAELERWVAPDTLLVSSTTATLVSDIQTACRHPERVLAGHPLNPPHLVPLVEVSGGDRTAPAAVDRAMAFYAALGKVPVRLNREIEGHIAGRLSAALYREAVHLVESGVASVEDVDRAVVHGPGLRWAAIGPHLTYHVGGGAGGIAHYLAHLGASQERRWASLGTPTLTEAVQAQLAAGVAEAARGRSVAELEAERDARIARALRALAARSDPPA